MLWHTERFVGCSEWSVMGTGEMRVIPFATANPEGTELGSKTAIFPTVMPRSLIPLGIHNSCQLLLHDVLHAAL